MAWMLRFRRRRRHGDGWAGAIRVRTHSERKGMVEYDVDREVAFVGQRVKQKICAALTLTAVIPLLILTYAIYAHVVPLLDPATASDDLIWFEALVIFTGLLMAA